jgi:hypothetical protein
MLEEAGLWRKGSKNKKPPRLIGGSSGKLTLSGFLLQELDDKGFSG